MSETERDETSSLRSSLHFLLLGALHMTDPMNLFAIYLSEVLEGQNYKLHGACTSNSSLCPKNISGLLRSTSAPPFLSTN